MDTIFNMEKVEQLLSDLRVEVAESKVHLRHISDHMAKLNGRTEKSEDRIALLENQTKEARTVWKTVAAIASVIGASLSWVYSLITNAKP